MSFRETKFGKGSTLDSFMGKHFGFSSQPLAVRLFSLHEGLFSLQLAFT